MVIVTNAELGWDCIVGVYETKELAVETLIKDSDGYVTSLRDAEDKAYIFHTGWEVAK